MEIQELKNIGAQVRRDIVRQVHSSQSGHPGGSLGCADMVVSLYFNDMKINEAKNADGFLQFNKAGEGEDLFLYLDMLPPATRAVSSLYYKEDLSIKEISHQLNISDGTVKWHLSECRNKLSKLLHPKNRIS